MTKLINARERSQLLPVLEEVEGRDALDPKLLHDGLRTKAWGIWRGGKGAE